MDEEELEKAVLSFLKKKGFKQTELAFQEEQQHQHTKNNSSTISSANSQSDPDFSRHLLAFSEYVILPPSLPVSSLRVLQYTVLRAVGPAKLSFRRNNETSLRVVS